MIYLDNAATTKPSKSAIAAAEKAIREDFFNPSALYYSARSLNNEIECARSTVCERLKCKIKELIFTSGATESNNWAITRGFKNKSGNIIVTQGEHPSVYEAAINLKNKGYDVRIAPLKSNGTVDVQKLLDLVDDKTSLVSVIHVSNETGAVNNIEEISSRVKEKNKRVIFHSDGVQAFCKIPVNLCNIDLYSISAHKVGGIKGIGALYISESINLSPFIYGGGQERKLRSGTENTVGILSFAAAVKEFKHDDRIIALYELMSDSLSNLKDVQINGDKASSSGYIMSIGIKGIKSEILQHMLFDDGVTVGLGSACSSKSKKNRVLDSMKVNKEFIEGNIRISFSFDTALEEVITAANKLTANIEKLRGMING